MVEHWHLRVPRHVVMTSLSLLIIGVCLVASVEAGFGPILTRFNRNGVDTYDIAPKNLQQEYASSFYPCMTCSHRTIWMSVGSDVSIVNKENQNVTVSLSLKPPTPCTSATNRMVKGWHSSHSTCMLLTNPEPRPLAPTADLEW